RLRRRRAAERPPPRLRPCRRRLPAAPAGRRPSPRGDPQSAPRPLRPPGGRAVVATPQPGGRGGARPAPTPTPDPQPTDGVWFLAKANLGVLIERLRADGRVVLGPKVADGAIVVDEIRSVEDLPIGW